MKRGGSLRRTGRLRQRSRTNSRKHIDVRLRGDYMRGKRCELCGATEPDPHHIAGGSPKVDSLSNLIAACRRCHDWCHADPILGKLRCWEIKLSKGELDEAEVDRALRQRVRGWLDSDKVKLRCELAGERWELIRMHLAESLDAIPFGESEE